MTKIINLILAKFARDDLVATKALLTDPNADLLAHMIFIN
jgi:hypothetical protein